MKKFAITKDMTTEQRLEVIRKIHAKFNKKLQRNQKVRKTETSFMDKYRVCILPQQFLPHRHNLHICKGLSVNLPEICI